MNRNFITIHVLVRGKPIAFGKIGICAAFTVASVAYTSQEREFGINVGLVYGTFVAQGGVQSSNWHIILAWMWVRELECL
jgi:hypothetical protein